MVDVAEESLTIEVSEHPTYRIDTKQFFVCGGASAGSDQHALTPSNRWAFEFCSKRVLKSRGRKKISRFRFF